MTGTRARSGESPWPDDRTGAPIRPLSAHRLPIARFLAGAIGAHYRWVAVALGAIGVAEVNFHANFYATLIPTLRAELSLSYSQAQSLLSAFSLTYGLMQIPVGLLLDRFGARRVALASITAFTLGAAITPFTRSYELGMVARLLVGVGSSAIYLPALRLIMAWFPPRRISTAMGLISIGSSVGVTSALLLVPLLSAALGWRQGYLVATLTLPAVLVLYALLYVEQPADVGLSIASTPTSPAHAPIGNALHAVLQNREVWLFSLAGGLYFGSYTGLIAWTPTYLIQGLGRSVAEAGTIASLLPISLVFIYPLTGLLSDMLGRRRLLLVGALLQGTIPIVFVAVAASLPTVGLAMFMALFAVSVSGILNAIPLAVQHVDRLFQSTATGLANGMFFVGAFVTPILLGGVVDLVGQLPAAFFGLSALALMALALGALGQERR